MQGFHKKLFNIHMEKPVSNLKFKNKNKIQDSWLRRQFCTVYKLSYRKKMPITRKRSALGIPNKSAPKSRFSSTSRKTIPIAQKRPRGVGQGAGPRAPHPARHPAGTASPASPASALLTASSSFERAAPGTALWISSRSSKAQGWTN